MGRIQPADLVHDPSRVGSGGLADTGLAPAKGADFEEGRLAATLDHLGAVAEVMVAEGVTPRVGAVHRKDVRTAVRGEAQTSSRVAEVDVADQSTPEDSARVSAEWVRAQLARLEEQR